MEDHVTGSAAGESMLAQLHTSEGGLSQREADVRRATYGPNTLKRERNTALGILGRQFKSSLIYLLAFASVFSFFLGDLSESVIITVILLINTLLGFFQEYRSERTVAKLSRLISKRITAVLFAGSVIEKDEATAVVYATGNATELGKIASLSRGTHKVTRYEQSLQAFSSFLLKVVLITLAVTFVVKLITTADLSHISQLLLFIVALAIAVVPEAPPVIAAVTLSDGAAQFARQDVVSKRLSSVEDLLDITLLCTDKTGTLTENRMTIQKLVSDDPVRFQQFAYATLESLGEPTAAGKSSFDAAYLAYIPRDIQAQAQVLKQVQVLPFDPEARRRRIVLEDATNHLCYLVVIGSAETLLDLAACPKKAQYQAEIAEDGKQGLRQLALAYREVPFLDHFDILAGGHDLIFLGFVALVDPLRPSTKQAIE
jgi:magnesium-transporting ATPase (P-type)